MDSLFTNNVENIRIIYADIYVECLLNPLQLIVTFYLTSLGLDLVYQHQFKRSRCLSFRINFLFETICLLFPPIDVVLCPFVGLLPRDRPRGVVRQVPQETLRLARAVSQLGRGRIRHQRGI